MDVLDRGNDILPDPRVVCVTNTVFLANLTNCGGDVRVIGTGHAREQVVLDLEVESSGQSSGNESTVGRRCFHL